MVFAESVSNEWIEDTSEKDSDKRLPILKSSQSVFASFYLSET